MQQIIVTLTSSDGAVTRKVMLKPEGKPVQLDVPAGTKVDVQVQGPVQGRPDGQAKTAVNHELQLKQVGKNLVIEGEGEQLIEITDFYATSGATLGSVQWSYAEPAIADMAATFIEGKAAEAGVAEASASLAGYSFPVFLGGAATMVAAGSSGNGAGFDNDIVSNIITGQVTAGQPVSSNGLMVKAYNASGVQIGADSAVAAGTGTYSINIGTYTGRVFLRVVDTNNTDPDHRDEATNLNLDISVELLAYDTAATGTTVVNINPMTTVAAQMEGLSSTEGGSLDVTQFSANPSANADVAAAFGLSGELTKLPVTTLVDESGVAQTPNTMGAFLAALSGMDVLGSMTDTIGAILAGINNGRLHPAIQEALLQGAAIADPENSGGVVELISDALMAAYSTSGYAISVIAGDNVIDADDDPVDNTSTYQFTVPEGTDASQLSLLFGQASGTGVFVVNGTQATYTLSVADSDWINGAPVGWADGPQVIALSYLGQEVANRLVLVNLADDAPSAVRLLNTTLSFAENTSTASGLKVADIAVADADGGNNVPNVIGADAAFFQAVDVNGKYVLRFLTATSLDLESKASYQVGVSVNGVDSELITVTLTDVNEAPTAVALNNTIASLAEDASTATRTKVADIAITDDVLGTNAITLSGADAASFEVDGMELFLKAGVALNYEGQTSYAVTVNVADGSVTGSTPVSTNHTLNITNVNEAPTLATPAVISLADTVAADTFANQTGTLAGSDVDAGTTLTYGITGGATGGSDVIGSTTYDISKAGTYGTLYVKSADGSYVYVPNATAINALTANATESFTVSTSDGALSGTATLTINVTGADDAPVLVSGFQQGGQSGDDDFAQIIIGQAMLGGTTFADGFTDADTGDAALVFSIVSVDGDTNVTTIPGLTVASDGTVTGTPTDASINYPHTYSVVVRATDANNPALFLEHTWSIEALKAPTIISFTVVDDNLGGGTNTAVGQSGDALTFTVNFSENVDVVGNPTITFDMGGATVIGTYSAGTGTSALTFTATAPAGDGTSVFVTSLSDNGGSIMGQQSGQSWTQGSTGQTASYTLDNTAPVVTSTYSTAENTSNDTTPHAITLAATEANGPITWSGLGGTDAASFTLTSGGTLTFTGVTDFETKSSYSFDVTASDAAGKVVQETITVNVTNVNEAPSVNANPIADVLAVTGTGYTVGNPLYLDGIAANISSYFTDPDTAAQFNTLTYSLAAGAPSWLNIDSTTGKLYGTAPAVPASDLAVTVQANDGANTVTKSFNIDLVSLPALKTTQNLDNVSNLDVRSKLVLDFTENLALGSGQIKIMDDMGTSGWTISNQGETRQDTTDNDVVITLTNGVVTDLTVGGVGWASLGGVGISQARLESSVQVSGSKLIINVGGVDATTYGTANTDWTFDWDFGANYHVEFDAGIVTAGANGPANLAMTDGTKLNFTTVTPVANATGAASQIMADDATLSAGVIWHNAHIGSSTGTATAMNFGSGSHALYMHSNTGADSRATTTTGYVDVTGFTADDLFYIDNMGSMSMTTTNGQKAATWSGSGASTKRALGNADNGDPLWVTFSDYTTPTITSISTGGGFDNTFETKFLANVVIFG